MNLIDICRKVLLAYASVFWASSATSNVEIADYRDWESACYRTLYAIADEALVIGVDEVYQEFRRHGFCNKRVFQRRGIRSDKHPIVAPVRRRDGSYRLPEQGRPMLIDIHVWIYIDRPFTVDCMSFLGFGCGFTSNRPIQPYVVELEYITHLGRKTCYFGFVPRYHTNRYHTNRNGYDQLIQIARYNCE